MENNWRYKTLELLENNKWPIGVDKTPLLGRVSLLRKKVLNEFSVEDLRLMIGQQEGLGYLIPLALEVLSNDLFAEGDFYEGDLLQSVLKVDENFWLLNVKYWQTLKALLDDSSKYINKLNIDTSKFDSVRL